MNTSATTPSRWLTLLLRSAMLLAALTLAGWAPSALAGCDGFGFPTGGCGGGGGGSGSLLMFTTNDTSATVTGVDGLILTEVIIPASYRGLPVTGIGPYAFAGNYLSSVTIPGTVTNIGERAFYNCISLTTVTISNGLSRIGDGAFSDCYSLTRIHVQGNAPTLAASGVFDSTPATIYYLPGTAGWGPQFGGRPTARWSLPTPLILAGGPSFGVRSNAFGFTISWAANVPVVVEACADLAARDWSPIATNTLAGGWSHFSDPDRASHPTRLYRVRSH